MTDFKKKKQYGQNFLTNPDIPRRIVAESGISENDGVIEIGPGFGILTRELSKVAKKVISVEIDSELIPILGENLKDCENVRIINNDILSVDVDALLREEFADMDVCVCANLPYYITSEIVMKLLEGMHRFRSITVMVQKEVADRFCSKSGSENYSAVTASISYYATVKKLFTVKAGSFSPKPKVDSAVIRFDLHEKPPVSPVDTRMFFEVIRAAFGQRRKTLSNALFASFGDRLSKAEITAAIEECGLTADIRGEMLDINAFSLIADKMYIKIKK